MNELIVTFCNDCPCMGVDTEPGCSYCVLSSIFNEECVIDDGSNEDYSHLIPPDWCRLRKGNLSVSLNPDQSKYDEIIKKFKEEIKKLHQEEIIIQDEKPKLEPEQEKFMDDIIDQALREIK